MIIHFLLSFAVFLPEIGRAKAAVVMLYGFACRGPHKCTNLQPVYKRNNRKNKYSCKPHFPYISGKWGLHRYILFLLFWLKNIDYGDLLDPSYGGYYPPGRPINVTLLADDRNIAVKWEPPSESHGNIRQYIITWAILPNFQDLSAKNIVDGNVTVSFIAIKDDIGRLFRIRVRAENVYGIGSYSLPRYIRIGCGNNMQVVPNGELVLTSPRFDIDVPLKSGVICQWHIATDPVNALNIQIKELALFDTVRKTLSNTTNCAQELTYVNISNAGLFCKLEDVGKEITTRQSQLTVVLITGVLAGGKGFSLRVTTAVKSPGPPVNLTTRVTDHAIVIAWQPPLEKTLPLTSYVIHYKVLPDGQAYRVTVSASMESFPINTDRWEGKLLSFEVTGMIRNITGDVSLTVYARASCRKEYYLQPGQSINITSPNYPDIYPSSIVCIWIMRCSPEANMRMTYYDFQLQDLPFCSSDYIKFSYKREPECARMNVPHIYDTGLQEINITFVTDNIYQYRGFLINILAKAFSSYHHDDISNTPTSVPRPSEVFTVYADVTTNARNLLTHHEVLSMDTQGIPEEKSDLPTTTPALSLTLQYSSSNSSALIFNSNTLNSKTSTLATAASEMQTTSKRNKLPNSSSVNQEILPTAATEASNTYTPDLVENSVQNLEQNATSNSSETVNRNPVVNEKTTTLKFLNETGKVGNTQKDNVHKAGQNVVTPALMSVGGGLIVVCMVLLILFRRRRRRRKISVETSIKLETPVFNRFLDENGFSQYISVPTYTLGDTPDLIISPLTNPQTVSKPLPYTDHHLIAANHIVHIFSQTSKRYRPGHIELYDIIQDSRKIESRDKIFKTKASRDVFGKPQSRKRHSTFPLCCSVRKRKVYREIERQMVVFGSFIEDKEALETRLRRRYAHRRTTSF